MIVFDASTLVSTTFRGRGVPAQALAKAVNTDRLAISLATLAELIRVLHRPSLDRFVDPPQRDDLLAVLAARAIVCSPGDRVTDCRDPNDNIYLELALAAGAHAIVSSDADLLMLHPWRGIRI
ncbi:putative toxin-antitoxin system toxin component, PIN family [Leptolyngbya sp. 15MV]|nr:putative toxin-antitoxin system toxin component, PIN family [Leptolyngbya sp. 15MV]